MPKWIELVFGMSVPQRTAMLHQMGVQTHHWPMPLSYHRPARRWARELGLQVIANASVHRLWGLSRSWPFCTVFRILRVESFRMFLSIHVYLWPLWTMKSFMEIGPHVFEKSGRQTDTAAWYIYIGANLHFWNYSTFFTAVILMHCVDTGISWKWGNWRDIHGKSC